MLRKRVEKLCLKTDFRCVPKIDGKQAEVVNEEEEEDLKDYYLIVVNHHPINDFDTFSPSNATVNLTAKSTYLPTLGTSQD